MKIIGKNIGKKYGKNWVFRELNFQLEGQSKVAIIGKNGVGKSTLLQIISGYLTPTEGTIEMDRIKKGADQLTTIFIGPYTEIIEELTLGELLRFHCNFKNAKIDMKEMAERASLPLNKFISDFSTGMKQRVKLIIAFYFDNDLIFMDEPTSNLDQEGFDWWKSELLKMSNTILIASNDKEEISLCEQMIELH